MRRKSGGICERLFTNGTIICVIASMEGFIRLLRIRFGISSEMNVLQVKILVYFGVEQNERGFLKRNSSM